MKRKKQKSRKRKKYGLHIIEGSLYAFASSEGKITDKDNIKGRISLVKEKLKRGSDKQNHYNRDL